MDVSLSTLFAVFSSITHLEIFFTKPVSYKQWVDKKEGCLLMRMDTFDENKYFLVARRFNQAMLCVFLPLTFCSGIYFRCILPETAT